MFLQNGADCLQPFPPLSAAVMAIMLQALKMACSWFSSTRKSCGGLYGFLSSIESLLLERPRAAVAKLTDSLLHGKNLTLHRPVPLLAAVVVMMLQALKMACSWFSSTRKSCGGL